MRIDESLALVGRDVLQLEGEDQQVARWGLCENITSTLDSYRPAQAPDRPVLLRAYGTAALIDEIQKGSAVASAFGAFRSSVTDCEAENARRLSVLAIARFDLLDVLAAAPNKTPVEHQLQALAFFIRGAWRVELPETRRCVRLWAQRVVRQYQLLPREWREL